MDGQPEPSSAPPASLVILAQPLRDAAQVLTGAAEIFQQLTANQNPHQPRSPRDRPR